MDAAGNFVVVWFHRVTATDLDVYARRFNASGVAQGLEFRVNTFTAGTQDWAEVAMNAAGDFIVTWASIGQDGDSGGIYAQRFDAAGVAIGGEFRINATTAGDQFLSHAALGNDGQFVVVWLGSAESGPSGFLSSYQVRGRRFDASGNPLAPEFTINESGPTTWIPQVALDPTGGFLVTWDQRFSAPGDWDIFARRFGADGLPLASSFRVNTDTAGWQTGARVDFASNGDFVVTWEGPVDSPAREIRARRYDTGGTPRGNEFRVNATTDGLQAHAGVAVMPDGSFVITWWGNGPGDIEGIFAQRFVGPTGQGNHTITLAAGQVVTGIDFGSRFVPPSTIDSVIIDNGLAQRSRVRSLTVTFSDVVTVAPDAFQLYRQDGSLVGLSVSTSVLLGRTVATLTFSGDDIIGGSLADGNYTLVIVGDLVQDAFSRGLDADGDGTEGGFRVDAFFRYFGDTDGDRDVDDFDLAVFDSTFGRMVGDPDFLCYLDFGGDGDVDDTDFFAFLERYGTVLNP